MAAAAGSAGLLGVTASSSAQSAEMPTPDMGPSQAPPITDVRDKVAYITGGSSGIGLGIAQALHEAGAKVILGNYDDKQFAEALKVFPANDPRVKTIVHDVMDRDAWERKADEIEKLFGPVNILVNNAGVGVMSGVVAGSMKDWDWAMGVNFWGPLYGVRTFVPRMLAGKQGSHIVTTSSTDGVLLGTAGIYAVTKLAVTGLMEQKVLCFAPTLALGKKLLRSEGMNAITNNDMWIFPAPEYRVGLQARCDAMLESMVDYQPMPEHIAAGHDRYYRTPIYVQEAAHRRATRKRVIKGI